MITSEIVKEFQEAINSGTPQIHAAKALGFTPQGIKEKARVLGTPIQTPETDIARITREFHERLDEFIQRDLNQRQIADELNTFASSISKLCSAAGVLDGKSYLAKRKQVANEMCQEVLDHLLKFGGNVSVIVDEKGFKIFKNNVRKYIKERGIELDHYRYAFRRHGYWEVLVGPYERSGKSDHILSCRCNLCGTQHKVSRINLESGVSTQCRECSYSRERTTTPMCCEKTGEHYRSMGKLAKALGVSQGTIRYHIRRNGFFEFEGRTYVKATEAPA